MSEPAEHSARTRGHRLPQQLVDRVMASIEGEYDVPPVRDAATVVLMRDSQAGPQAYLLRRHLGMAFAAGMTVFPGGGVDPRDSALTDDHWSGPSASWFAERLRCTDALARELVCAAVRETFEESGVLLAGPDGDSVVADTSGDDWESERVALIARELALHELLERRGLILRADLVRPWAHWITPEFETKRYDTRFFVAALPAGQRTRDVGGEADQVQWCTPTDALAAVDRGEAAMLPPTATTLTELAEFTTVADVVRAADDRTITTFLPKAVLVDGEVRLLLNGDPGYES
jgi:8-oxo-dGTP pyrophosphatase MutT (NUDIX family)